MKRFAIIVTYNPIVKRLESLCDHLIKNDVFIVIVENTEKSYITSLLQKKATIIELKYNSGIAKAQNTGIAYALEKGADIIIFFDQDSYIEDMFISNLLSPIKNEEPLIVAPVFFDEKKNFEYPSFKFNKLKLLKSIYKENREAPYEVDVIISSGSAATKKVFYQAGLMDEDLFIDFVDIEWAIRCRNNNIPILIVPTAIMKHSIGNTSVNLGIVKGFIHSADRSYYKVRNPFLLLHKNTIPKILAIKEILSALIHEFVFIFYGNKKVTYFKNYILAIFHGVKGLKGKRIQ